MEILDQYQRPLRDLRISVIDACNFRCNYCMPAEIFRKNHRFLPASERLSWDQLYIIVSAFTECGVKKIRLTGGEPLLRKGLSDFIFRIKENLPIEDIALTTNGYYLEENVRELKAAGLNRITTSLDSLDPDKMYQINGKKDAVPKILDGLEAAIECGFHNIKINMVVQRNVNDEDILPMVDYFRNRPFTLRFIEFMDVGTQNQWNLDQVVPSREIVEWIQLKYPIEPLQANYVGEVASRYRYVDGAGEIGFISSVTQPFCQDCSRIRITSNGQLFTCLFASKGINLKSILTQESAHTKLKSIIIDTWKGRKDRYSEERAENSHDSRRTEMYQMGG